MSIISILHIRHGSMEEARTVLVSMVDSFLANPEQDPEELLESEGIEPDYLLDFIYICEKVERWREQRKRQVEGGDA